MPDEILFSVENGAATGSGMDVALMCDIRLKAASARFAETCAQLGLVPGLGGAWYLPRIVGVDRALDLLWTGRWVEAANAQALGLVTHVFPDDIFARRSRATPKNWPQRRHGRCGSSSNWAGSSSSAI